MELDQDQDRAVYAAYFNVARHNLLLSLNSIGERAGLSHMGNDESLASHPVLSKIKVWADLQSGGKTISDADIRLAKQIIPGLQKALPVLDDDFAQMVSGQSISRTFTRHPPQAGAAGGKFPDEWRKKPKGEKAIRSWRIEDLHWVLTQITAALNALRNGYTHAGHKDAVLSQPMTLMLNAWFDAARRYAKDRFGYTQAHLEHLERIDPQTKKEKRDFIHRLTHLNRSAFGVTPRGAAFFCCLFLDKQQSKEFLMQLREFRHGRGAPHQATLRTYTGWGIQLPFVRLDPDSSAQGVALDMLNEITRCPVEIYDNLSPEQQKEFEVQIDDDLSEASPETPTDSEGDEAPTSRLIRHRDRFAPLIMQCFDHMAQANSQHDPGIRFQLDLGDFYFRTYAKPLPDGTADTRRLKQKVLRFGLLSQAREQAKNKPEAWTALERVNTAPNSTDPYIVQTAPHYHLSEEGGSIGIQVVESLKQNTEAPMLYDAPQGEKNSYEPLATQRPHFWLSPYELVNLAFYHQLRLTHSLPDDYPSVGDFLRRYRSSYKELLKSIHGKPDDWQFSSKDELADKLKAFNEGFYTFAPKDLPEDLVRLLTRKAARVPAALMLAQAKNTLELLIQDGAQRLETVQRVKDNLKNRIKPGKVGYRSLRAGEMATFLAKDLLKMQPYQDASLAHKGKPTTAQTDVLQSRLAYFGRDKDSLSRIFESLHLTNNRDHKKNHPFLGEIKLQDQSIKGIAQFYEAYLKQRKIHLKGVQERLEREPDCLSDPTLSWLGFNTVPTRMQGKDDLETLAGTYLKRMKGEQPPDEPPAPLDKQPKPPALNLPRGLFRDLIIQALLSLQNKGLTTAIQAALAQEAQRAKLEDPEDPRKSMRTSVSHLIDLYFQHHKNQDRYQEFYRHKLSKLEQRKEETEGPNWRKGRWFQEHKQRLRQQNPDLSPQEMSPLLKEKWDQQIDALIKSLRKQMRVSAAQDQVLFLAARHLITLCHTPHKAKVSMQEMHDKSIDFLSKLKLETLKRDSLDFEVEHAQTVGEKEIYDEKIKVKNIGRFKHLLRDRRLGGLLHYYQAQRIHHRDIQYQLRAYPKAQQAALRYALIFEAYAQKNQPPSPSLDKEGSIHRTLLARYLKSSSLALTLEERQQLQTEILTIRNAFCHNQLPQPEGVKTGDEAAMGMLEQAKQNLAPKLLAPNGGGTKPDETAANYFAEKLRACYLQIAPQLAIQLADQRQAPPSASAAKAAA